MNLTARCEASNGSMTLYGCVEAETGQVVLIGTNGRTKKLGLPEKRKEAFPFAISANKGGLFEVALEENGLESHYVVTEALDVVAFTELRLSSPAACAQPQSGFSEALHQAIASLADDMDSFEDRLERLERMHPELTDS